MKLPITREHGLGHIGHEVTAVLPAAGRAHRSRSPDAVLVLGDSLGREARWKSALMHVVLRRSMR